MIASRAIWPALLVASCSTSEDAGELPPVMINTPARIDFAPGLVVHELCAVGDAGATLHVADVSEGMFDRLVTQLASTMPPAGCPDGGTGWATVRWSSRQGIADATFWQALGPVISTPVTIRLSGTPFAGYAVQMPEPPRIDDSQAIIELTIGYRQPNTTATVPAVHVPFTVSTEPMLELRYPDVPPSTDLAGSATLVLAPPMQATAVFVTPMGGDPQLVTTLLP